MLTPLYLNSCPSLPNHASTLAKSLTKDGMLHLIRAALPLIMYSDKTSASKYWFATRKVNEDKEFERKLSANATHNGKRGELETQKLSQVFVYHNSGHRMPSLRRQFSTK